MCKKGIGSTLMGVGLPLAGGLAGAELGPMAGLTAGEGGAIGGALGGLGGGFASGAKPLMFLPEVAGGALGGFGLGESGILPSLGGSTAAPVSGPVASPGGAAPGVSAPGAAPSVGGASADAGTSIDQMMAQNPDLFGTQQQGGGGIMGFLQRNPWLLSAAGVGTAALMGNQPMPGEKQLKGLAGEAGQVAQLSSAMQTGQLPPGMQGLVQNQLNNQIAAIKSSYASMGLSGSTMEAQDIAAAQSQAAAQTAQLASSVTQTGLQAAGLSGELYNQIAQYALGQDQELSNALAGLAQGGGYGAGLKSAA